jgi:tetratricopeptide (TPR) repeat protein
MAKRKPPSHRSGKSPPQRPVNHSNDPAARRQRSEIRLRQVPGKQQWELVHPRSVRDRAEDLQEVRAMIDLGEDEIATEELRWLLDGCSDFIEAHKLLGELALTAEDFKLARGHFGYAWDIGIAALPDGGLSGPLAYERPANQPFFEAAKGLAWSLIQLGLADKAREILDRMLQLDPSDPLGAAEMRARADRPGAD